MHALSGCYLSTKFDMLATVLRQYAENDSTDPSPGGGYYEFVQDEVTGNLKREWHATDPDDEEAEQITIPCSVRGITDGGIRVAGTTERFDREYQNIDWARMVFPSSHLLTKRDRITNIRESASGRIIWVDWELAVPTAEPNELEAPATVFDVNGVTPVPDPFGMHIENVALLERSEVTSTGAEKVKKVWL